MSRVRVRGRDVYEERKLNMTNETRIHEVETKVQKLTWSNAFVTIIITKDAVLGILSSRSMSIGCSALRLSLGLFSLASEALCVILRDSGVVDSQLLERTLSDAMKRVLSQQ